VAANVVGGRRFAETPAAKENVVAVHSVLDRFGNNMHQLLHALVYAEATNHTLVRWLPSMNHLSKVFIMQRDFNISHFMRHVKCDRLSRTPNFFGTKRTLWSQTCSGARHEDYIRVARTYLVPLFRPSIQHGCKDVSEHTLTIHGRWGDIANSNHPQAAVPPCAFYDAIIREFNFTQVRFVSDADAHPCINILRNRRDISFTLITDFTQGVCELVHAPYLVVPDSTFSKSIVLMNANAKLIFSKSEAFGGEWKWFDVGSNIDPLGEMTQCAKDAYHGVGRPAWLLYSYKDDMKTWNTTNVKGMDSSKPKLNYMTNTTLDSLQLHLERVCRASETPKTV
jgi:hypothetical protein